MHFARFVLVILASTLTACTTVEVTSEEEPKTVVIEQPVSASTTSVAVIAPGVQVAKPGRFAPPKDITAYKTQVAARIADGHTQMFSGELPPILKSVVVLDVTVDRDGKPTRVLVSRSNGFKDLEKVAIESVRRAGVFPAPTAAVLQGRGNVRYLETWLFRADGKFQLRSLVTQPQPGAERMASKEGAEIASLRSQ